MAGLATLTKQINALQKEIDALSSKPDKASVSPMELKTSLEKVEKRFIALERDVKTLQDEEQLEIPDIDEKLKKLRQDLLAVISSSLGGGSINRQLFINGVDPLTRFTDINLKAGSGVTLTYANNNQTQKVDVTITSTGGGGGTVRSINNISTSQTAGSTAGTDYVYLCSGTLTLTLPDAAANTNLYTVKNVGTGVVTVNTTSAQTIDGSSTAVMTIQYTAIDLISDTANWNIT